MDAEIGCFMKTEFGDEGTEVQSRIQGRGGQAGHGHSVSLTLGSFAASDRIYGGAEFGATWSPMTDCGLHGSSG
jgi:hypothetical protein